MLILISSSNFIQLFLGWEGVGLCSYLLINFWFTRLQANKSALKAMIVNRVGDLGLALAIVSIFIVFKSLDFSIVFSLVPYIFDLNFFFFNFYVNPINLISLLLFIGAIGKSAQLGLHSWLPDAMEGPTPVSALIHAATMVTAGVFLLIRCSPIYEYSSSILFFVAILGASTAFFAGTIGIFQNDLKKVIAYSTCSQLGYMVFACGLSNYTVSFFHVLNHAYFKALLFLSAGSIIHALANEQDMRKMGGFLEFLPFTYIMILIGSLALTGFPFLTGFYSKDMILEISYSKFNFLGTFSHLLGLLSAIITAFYSFKIIYMVFLSKPNGFKRSSLFVSEAPIGMALPLLILSLCSIFLGFFTKDIFIGLGTPFWNNSIVILPCHLNIIDSEFIPVYVKWLPLCASFFGGALSIILYHFLLGQLYILYSKNSLIRFFYLFFSKKWLFDRLQNDLIIAFFLKLGYNTTYKTIDKGVIEFYGPSGYTKIVLFLSKFVSQFTSGKINQYAFLIFVFLVLLISFNFVSKLLYIYIDFQLLFILILCLII
jgi:NADH-ubiquinone oxidoreductase chain 5